MNQTAGRSAGRRSRTQPAQPFAAIERMDRELSACMDRLLLEGMTFFGRHGALPAERELGARFSVDVVLEADLADAGRSDRLEDTVDYVRAYAVVQEVVEGEPCRLLEAVAD